jgi:hypothetical protein
VLARGFASTVRVPLKIVCCLRCLCFRCLEYYADMFALNIFIFMTRLDCERRSAEV